MRTCVYKNWCYLREFIASFVPHDRRRSVNVASTGDCSRGILLCVGLEIGLLQFRADPAAREECVVKGGKVHGDDREDCDGLNYSAGAFFRPILSSLQISHALRRNLRHGLT